MVAMNLQTLIAIVALIGPIAPTAAEQPEPAAFDRMCFHHVQPQPATTVADVAVTCETATWPAEPRCRDPRLREHGEVRVWRAVLHEDRGELVVHVAFDARCVEGAQS